MTVTAMKDSNPYKRITFLEFKLRKLAELERSVKVLRLAFVLGIVFTDCILLAMFMYK